MKKGFSLIELVIVLVVIGILSTLGYKGYNSITESSVASHIADFIKKAETAYAKTMSLEGTTRPSHIGTGATATEICFDFQTITTGDPYIDQSGTATAVTTDNYAEAFNNTMRDILLGEMGFNEKSTGGLYLPKIARSKFFLCAKNGARYFLIKNVKGSIALKALKSINNGSTPTLEDGLSSSKRVSVWMNSGALMYGDSHIEADAETVTTSDGLNNPIIDETTLELQPAVTISFVLNSENINNNTGSW